MNAPHLIFSLLLLAPASAVFRTFLSSSSRNGSVDKPVELRGFRRRTSIIGTRFLNTKTVLDASTKSSDGDDDDKCVISKELNDTQKLMKRVKDAKLAGAISYGLWEVGFWSLSVPVCILGYRGITGRWPDLKKQEDLQKLGAEAFAFVNCARFAVPLRIGLALGTTPWIQKNFVDKFNKCEPPVCDTDE